TQKKENHMLKMLGILLNLGVLAYLGYQAAACRGMEQIVDVNTWQNPWILSFIGIVALFIVLRN
ncbi:MAG: hypothetical protein WA096_02140, partial [Smithella sp.]